MTEDKIQPIEILTKKRLLLLATSARKSKDVFVERLGGSVKIVEFSAGVRGDLEVEYKENRLNFSTLRFHLILRSVVDPDGKGIFTTAEEVAETLPYDVANDLCSEIMELNGMKQEAVPGEKLGNLHGTDTDGSSTDSPSNSVT